MGGRRKRRRTPLRLRSQPGGRPPRRVVYVS